jgi:hypothetical protein
MLVMPTLSIAAGLPPLASQLCPGVPLEKSKSEPSHLVHPLWHGQPGSPGSVGASPYRAGRPVRCT